MVDNLGLVDAQHFLLAFHELVGMMDNDMPSDNDATFAWVTFNSYIKLLNIVGVVDGKMLKLILKIRRPTDIDNDDNRDKYLRRLYDLSEQMLNNIGWPQDVGGDDET